MPNSSFKNCPCSLITTQFAQIVAALKKPMQEDRNDVEAPPQNTEDKDSGIEGWYNSSSQLYISLGK